MRVYSIRERVLFGLALLLCLGVSAGVALVIATQPGAVRDVLLWVAGAGGLAGSLVCLKIIITRHATANLEQDVRDVFGLRESSCGDDAA